MAHRFRNFAQLRSSNVIRRTDNARNWSKKIESKDLRPSVSCQCAACRSKAAPKDEAAAHAPSETRVKTPERRSFSQHDNDRDLSYPRNYPKKKDNEERHIVLTAPTAAPCSEPGTSHSMIFVDRRKCEDDCHLERKTVHCDKWSNYDVKSVDSNFTITRVFASRFSFFNDTLFFRIHLRGKLATDDSSITLTIPLQTHVSADGVDDQFSVAMISSESGNMMMFAPVQIMPGSKSIILNQMALRADTLYDVWAQGFLEV